MAVAHSRFKFVAVSLPTWLRGARFLSETAVRRFKKLNRHLDPEAAVSETEPRP
jgi:hypothetical protein